MRSTPRMIAATLVVASFVAACGGSDDDADDTAATNETAPATDTAAIDTSDTAADTTAAPDTAPPPDTAPAPETAPPPETEPPDVGQAPTSAVTDPPAATAPAGGVVDVTLVEWAIEAPVDYAAGEITFNAINGGNFPHELVVIAGESYESLPLTDNGAVIEDELPTGALIGRTSRFGSGASEALTVELTPGSYVLLCNIAVGPNSHAGAGQRLDITVT